MSDDPQGLSDFLIGSMDYYKIASPAPETARMLARGIIAFLRPSAGAGEIEALPEQPHIYGKDCPVGSVQVEFVTIDPALRQGKYGWRPTDREAVGIELYIDGQRFSMTAGNIGAHCSDGVQRRGLHIIHPIGCSLGDLSSNAISLTTRGETQLLGDVRSSLTAPAPGVQTEALHSDREDWFAPQRWYLDHGMLCDRLTGKSTNTSPDEICARLNELDRAALPAPGVREAMEECAKLCDQDAAYWRTADPKKEPWSPEQMTMRLTEAEWLAAKIRARLSSLPAGKTT